MDGTAAVGTKAGMDGEVCEKVDCSGLFAFHFVRVTDAQCRLNKAQYDWSSRLARARVCMYVTDADATTPTKRCCAAHSPCSRLGDFDTGSESGEAVYVVATTARAPSSSMVGMAMSMRPQPHARIRPR